ncbi:MAG: aldo/keto reductase [Peptococcaceae bacterium BICA1-7]|nr:MAG: aldo/keto reductase [Peptococcaceae bacterium BICA1-7]HBV95729.1 aldo/keto reductase [Desulfotomaculum sp.]
MEYGILGRTGIRVSRLCFGSLTVGPLQANLPLREGARVISSALDAGVNFIDTARLYLNYNYIREGIAGRAGSVVIATKSYDYTGEGVKESIEEALKSLDRDYIDIFLLHEQESDLTIRGHWEAVEELIRARDKGTVRAIGISTHSVRGVMAAAAVPEFDVIHPIINVKGIGIKDGSVEQMKAAIAGAAGAGKGLYGMKALGGGNLISERKEALAFALSVPGLASVAVGMQSPEEVLYNTAVFEGAEVPPEIERAVSQRNRRLHIEDWCAGCGQCVERCRSGALSLSGGKAVVSQEDCRLCGYCSTACEEMCIKII